MSGRGSRVPWRGTILADFGADVIKVEQPGRGDPFRYLYRTQNAPGAEVNYTWIMDGRNKRSITLDLKSAEGQEVLRKLIPECDVYLTNQPMGVRRRMKLTYEDIAPLNDRMVYASLTAYGERGPEAEKTGFDGMAYWIRSGLSDMVRSPGGGPSQSIAGMGGPPHMRGDVRLRHDGSLQAADHRQGWSGIDFAAGQRVLVRQLPGSGGDRRRGLLGKARQHHHTGANLAPAPVHGERPSSDGAVHDPRAGATGGVPGGDRTRRIAWRRAFCQP